MFKKFFSLIIILASCFSISINQLQSGEHPGYLLIEGIANVVFSPDGRLVAYDNGISIVKIWDILSNREIDTIKIRFKNESYYSRIYNDRRDISNIRAIAFSPDSRYVAIGSRDVRLTIYDRYKKEIIYEYKWEWKSVDPAYTYEPALDHLIVASIAFSPDGKYLAAGTCDGKIRVIDTQTFNVIKTIQAHKRCTQLVKFIKNGNVLLSCSFISLTPPPASTNILFKIYEGYYEFKKFNFLTGNELQTFNIEGNFYFPIPAVSKDSKYIAIYSYKSSPRIKKYDLETGRELTNSKLLYNGSVYSMCFAPDSRYLTFTGLFGTLALLDLATGKIIKNFNGHGISFKIIRGGVITYSNINSVSFSIDGKYIVSGGADHQVCIWNVKEGFLEKIIDNRFRASELIQNFELLYPNENKFIFLEGYFLSENEFRKKRKLKILEARGDNYLREGRITHPPSNVVDGNLSTAWIEGAEGYGLNIGIDLKFNRMPSSLSIIPGFATSKELWFKNFRVSCLKMEFYNMTDEYPINKTLFLFMKFENGVVPFAKKQYFDLRNIINKVGINRNEIKSVRFTILEADCIGAIYQDTAISEIELYD